MKNKITLSYFLAGLSILFWSTVATAFKLTLREISYIMLVLYASITSFIIFFIYNIIKHNNIFDKKIYFSIIMGFLNPFLYYILLFKGYSLLKAQEALLLNYTWPISITLFSALFFRQKITINSIFSFILAFIGIYIISANKNFHFDINALYPLASAVIWGIYWNLNISDTRKSEVKLLWNFFFSIIFTLIFIYFSKIHLIFPYKAILGSIYIGFFEMGLTFLLWLNALAFAKKTSHVAILVYLAPIFSLFWIASILKEHIAFKTFVGLIIILFAIFLENIHIMRKKR